MATFNFTESRIAGLSAPAKGEEVHNDTAVSGLCVRARAGGAASYFVRYRNGGRGSQQRRYTIGPAGSVSLAEARRLASKVLSDVRNGVDPAAAKKALAEAGGKTTTLAELVDTHERDQLFRGVVTAKATATLLRRDFLQIVGENRDPRTITRLELVQCIERVRDGAGGRTLPPRPGLALTLRARVYGLFETGGSAWLPSSPTRSPASKPRDNRESNDWSRPPSVSAVCCQWMRSQCYGRPAATRACVLLSAPMSVC